MSPQESVPERFDGQPELGEEDRALVEGVLARHGYALVLQIASHTEGLERYRQLAMDHRVDGVFITDLSGRDPRVELVRELGMPAIAVNSAAGCEAG